MLQFLLDNQVLKNNVFMILSIIGVSLLYGGQSMGNIDPFKDARSYVVNKILRYNESEWINTPSIISFGNIPFEIHFWHTMILRKEAIPYEDKADTKSAFRPGNEVTEDDDLLRFKFNYKSMSITLYESGPMFYTVVENVTGVLDKENDQKEKIMMISNTLFNIKEPREFKAISKECEYTFFSTNPGCPFVRVDDWSDRIDCSANEKRIIFIMFKMSNYQSRVVIKPSYKWFPPEMRNFKP